MNLTQQHELPHIKTANPTQTPQHKISGLGLTINIFRVKED